MTRRLSSRTGSHTDDSIFLRPDEDPVWLDEPTTTTTAAHTQADRTGGELGTPEPEGGAPKGAPGGGDDDDDGEGLRDGELPMPRQTELYFLKMTALLVELHCWGAFFAVQQLMGYWLYFFMLGFGPLSSMYKTLQVIDFYMAFLMSGNPLLGDTLLLMRETFDCKKHRWIIDSTGCVGIAIFVIMTVHLVCKYYYNYMWWASAAAAASESRDGGGTRAGGGNDNNNRRQSVNRQPSFTLSEWTDAQEDLLDPEPEPQTPQGFDPQGAGLPDACRTEGDGDTLTVTPGLQERRGSNVSLTLDMCTPGCTEPYGYGTQLSPRDQSAKEYLREGTHPLTPALLHTRALEDQALQAEFYETPMNFVAPKEYNYPGLVRKNRYKTILPNTHSRVILKSADEEDFLTTYINANYLKGYGDEEKAYIATQGPTVNTVGDFWRMVWQERCPIIVMITNLEEKNEKCAEYWPEDTVTHEGIQITVVTVTQEDDYSLRVFTLKCSGEERSLRQYWYTSWPDQKTPDKAPPLLELVQEVERAREDAPLISGPTIVHCSAGIGRTGCFIATSILCKQLRYEDEVDILKTTCQLRLDRGGMIQTCEQYQFVHHVLSLYEKQLNHTAEE